MIPRPRCFHTAKSSANRGRSYPSVHVGIGTGIAIDIAFEFFRIPIPIQNALPIPMMNRTIFETVSPEGTCFPPDLSA